MVDNAVAVGLQYQTALAVLECDCGRRGASFFFSLTSWITSPSPGCPWFERFLNYYEFAKFLIAVNGMLDSFDLFKWAGTQKRIQQSRD